MIKVITHYCCNNLNIIEKSLWEQRTKRSVHKSAAKNGIGKTTLLNIITGNEPCDKGKIEIGTTLQIGYYKQEDAHFDPNKRVIEVIQEIAEDIAVGDGRRLSPTQFLNYFLFPHSMHYSYISKLSGGEKKRLYLMTILMRNPNFLILDEPTNDLDIVTLNVLEDFLSQHDGCVLIVSHDRFFMDKVVDHLFVFEGNGKIKETESHCLSWEQDRLEKHG